MKLQIAASMAILANTSRAFSRPTDQSSASLDVRAIETNDTLVRREDITQCGAPYSCSSSYGLGRLEMEKLDNIIQAIPASGRLTTKCKIVDCVGYLCAFPTVNGGTWTQVMVASGGISAQCGEQQGSASTGCGASSFEYSMETDGGLRYGYVPAPENHPGGNPGTLNGC